MNFFDAFRMSAYNLWSRKGRTLLNLVGILISCVMLTMTLAGTRGAREGVFDIMNASDQTKQFMILESYDRRAKVPNDQLAIPDGVSDDRRERIVTRLEKSWRSKNAKPIRLNREQMKQLRSIDQVSSIVWQRPVPCRFVWPTQLPNEESTDKNKRNAVAAKPTRGSLIGINTADSQISNRVVAGNMVSDQDDQGVMVDEFTAYKLGFRTDDQLDELIGTKVNIRYSLGRINTSPASILIPGFDSILNHETIKSLRSVADQLDRTDLSDDDKKAVRNALKLLPAEDSPAKTNSPQEPLPPDVEVDSKGNRTLVRDGIIRGVLKQQEDDDLFGFLQFTGRGSQANLYINHKIAEEFYSRKVGFKGYWSVAGSVSDVADLGKTIQEVESLGFRTRSAVSIIEKLEREVGKVRMAIGALALLILLVAAVGICNTMIIAILERTAEFGIMKSVGAEDSQVLIMVLLEGLVTGLIGAALAVLISLGVAELVSEIARGWIEERLKGSFDQPVFRFHPLDTFIVFAIAAIMCVLASLIPAWRAAKLDPVAAMKKS